MDFSHVSPTQGRAVWVEWKDITTDLDEPCLVTKFSLGVILAEDQEFDGIPCIILGRDWEDGGGWSDFATIPQAVVLDILDIVEQEEDNDGENSHEERDRLAET